MNASLKKRFVDRVTRLFGAGERDARVRDQLDGLRKKTPVPMFWLFGKTQTGKTSVIKYLTGADEAEIGHGFRPCTRYSREYLFPTADAPLLRFLDTRGVDEPGYDPGEDLARFNSLAHVVLVTVKLLDHAQENVLRHLQTIRQAQPSRPIVLALTCLHEAYPQQQHPQPYPFEVSGARPNDRKSDSGNGSQTSPEDREGAAGPPGRCPVAKTDCPPDLARSMAEQCRRFEALYDFVIPIDLTRPEEGFNDPVYGGDRLKEVLLEVLPSAYRQTLLTLDEAMSGLQEAYARHVLPHIAGYSTLAATAGAIPVPWVDLLILPGIQTRMIYHLAQLYGQPLSGTRFLELASTLGLGVVFRQALREVIKFIPYVGSVAGGALAGASTFALGKAFCYYYSAVHQGHVPRADELKRYYEEQLAQARKHWVQIREHAARGQEPAVRNQESSVRNQESGNTGRETAGDDLGIGDRESGDPP